MQDKILNGREFSNTILDNLAREVAKCKRPPCLAVVLVGTNPASCVYVNNKKKACEKIGFTSKSFELPETTTQDQLLKIVHDLNQDKNVDGILVQMPLPKHLDSKLIIDNITPHKDVDGFHRYNIGSLALNDPQICPCTPHGVMYMLEKLNPTYHGLNAVVIGMSNIVGRPMALELINRGATVTICNSKTKNLAELCRHADLLIVGVGRPKMVKASWVKPGSIVIDIGMNRLDNGKLCGDVDFDEVLPIAGYITPVPGGVGLMTIAMLMQNTMHCYTKQFETTGAQ
ncbi:MAG: bifunctional methylenetetrahydrofolate dehydrogenase/methenyltetrahydrofolate cyclohydrolase FolD [Burkholderiales bacterium]|jgi:methylenetetrahydrofolate dehydrogenase (NADP+)/methenyltetrahydrofolate cyclohydrolase|nr:bifunctional methylenetetrahydrofolate dehydrogenase/methenyltetrahydrofolate cyclohydrolase FolD [Burkholderiales bacterium]